MRHHWRQECFKVPVIIRNRAGYLLIRPLNNGTMIHLAPAETSEPVTDLEVAGNEKIEKLVQAGLIAIAGRPPREGQRASSRGETDFSELSGVITTNDGTRSARLESESRSRQGAFRQCQPFALSVSTGLFLALSIQVGTFVEIPTNALGLLGISAGGYLVSKVVS